MYFGPCTFFVVFSSSKLYKSWTLTYDRAVINKEKFADGVIVQSGLLPVLNYWHFSHSMRCGIYETAEHPSVCLSVSVTHRSTATVACSGCAAEHHAAEEVNRQRRVSNSSGTAALRSAANAGSVRSRAEERGSTLTCWLCSTVPKLIRTSYGPELPVNLAGQPWMKFILPIIA